MQALSGNRKSFKAKPPLSNSFPRRLRHGRSDPVYSGEGAGSPGWSCKEKEKSRSPGITLAVKRYTL